MNEEIRIANHEKDRMNKKPIIEVENLTARYGNTTILENVSFRVCRGEIFMLLGGSGCGKSTLLKHLNGLLNPIRDGLSSTGQT